jgi:hypothetical protein
VELIELKEIRKLTDYWAKKTYREMLSAASMDDKIKSRLRKVLRGLNVMNSKVVGESITGLEKTSEGQGLPGITYSQAFEFALEKDKNHEILPVLYLKNLAINLNGVDDNRFKGIIARGLRTLPSLLRDRDFAERLEMLVGSYFPGMSFKIETNAGKDTKEHTDVYLIVGGETFRIWLYQFTPRGLPHDIERVLGKRGEIPSGIHILCPIKTDLMMEREKLERKKGMLESRAKKYREEYERCRNKRGKRAKEILEKIKSTDENLETINKRFKKVNRLARAEAVSINGWYFYSDAKIKELLKNLNAVYLGSKRADEYERVCSILRGPERYLGKIRIFQKK